MAVEIAAAEDWVTPDVVPCDMALSRATRFTDAWVAGIDAIVRGEGNRAIWCVGSGRP